MKKQPETSWQYPGAISPEFVYTARELVGRLGWSAEDVSLACSKGLKTHVFANHVYIFGSDVIAFLQAVNPNSDGTVSITDEAAA